MTQRESIVDRRAFEREPAAHRRRRIPPREAATSRSSATQSGLEEAVLGLQHASGNAAVVRLLQRQPTGILAPPGPASATAAVTPHTDWSTVPESERMAYVMTLLVETYGYPEEGAAGLVGNLYEESGLIPSRVEGSDPSAPMRARGASGKVEDFTAEEIMKRKSSKSGPKKPGVGIAQWTTKKRRAGLFKHGADILFDMDAQVDYLVNELGTSYAKLDKNLRKPGVTVEAANDDVVYLFEIPGSILEEVEVTAPDGTAKKKKVKRARTDPQVVKVLERRRKSGKRALKAYRAAKTVSTPAVPGF
jgi:HSP20 family molecular chaperone IbpA